MVEVLLLVALIVGIRAVYLRVFRGKEEATEFVEKSANNINQIMGRLALVLLIGLGLIVVLIAALVS